MRKILVALILVMLTVVTVGCAKKPNAPSPCWTYVEEYTYESKYIPKDTDLSVVGELKYKIELLNNADVACGEYAFTGFYGTKITSSMKIVVEGVENTIETVSFINNKLGSYLSSYKFNLTANENYKILENKREIIAKFDAKNYTYKENGTEKTIKTKGKLAVDNNALYVILRAYDVLHASFSSKYFIPDPISGELFSLALSSKGASELEILGNKIPTVCIELRYDDKFSGSPMQVYYAKDDIVHNDISLTKVPVKIVEAGTTYQLKSIDFIKNTRN